jgi:hypothetical protein
MSDANSTPPAGEGEQGILASLPHTRPQRPSARRAAARASAVKRASATSGKEAKPAQPKRPRPKATRAGRAPKATSAKAPDPLRAPRQGFESESEPQPGKSVAPPSSAELAASVVELLGELAQSGLTSGGRMLRETLGRLPGA